MTSTDPESASTRATAPILGPGHTYASVTDKISAIVLVRPYNWRWFLGFGIGFLLTMMLLLAVDRAALSRRRHLGDRRPGHVGIRDRQFRLVDRDRPRGNLDLGDPACCSSRTGEPRSTVSPRR